MVVTSTTENLSTFTFLYKPNDDLKGYCTIKLDKAMYSGQYHSKVLIQIINQVKK
jgi:hypothetical protein